VRERLESRDQRRYLIRYAVLTIALCAPLAWAFAARRNLYPFASWTVMSAPSPFGQSRTFYVLRGETVAGETVDVRAIEFTDAMSGRLWTMFGATVQNLSFKIPSPHPANAKLAAEAGGVDKLPAGARLPELLGAYGELYNARLPDGSTSRLRAVRLESYRWNGRIDSVSQDLAETWRHEL
jgi:hypothetical protein